MMFAIVMSSFSTENGEQLSVVDFEVQRTRLLFVRDVILCVDVVTKREQNGPARKTTRESSHVELSRSRWVGRLLFLL